MTFADPLRLLRSCTLDAVADHQSDSQVPDPIRDWFAERGFAVAISQSDGVFWADLLDADDHMVAPRYGRGGQPAEAAERAKERYLDEQ